MRRAAGSQPHAVLHYLPHTHQSQSPRPPQLDEFRSLHLQLTEIKASWAGAAAGGDTVSAEQVHQLVAAQGFALEAPALRSMCAAFDPDRNGEGWPACRRVCLCCRKGGPSTAVLLLPPPQAPTSRP